MKSSPPTNTFAPASPKTGRFSLATPQGRARTPSSALETGAAGPACDRISTQADTLRRDLRHLANWLLLRSVQDHDRQTTLTILSRKVAALRAKKYEHDIIPEANPHSHAENSTAGGM